MPISFTAGPPPCSYSVLVLVLDRSTWSLDRFDYEQEHEPEPEHDYEQEGLHRGEAPPLKGLLTVMFLLGKRPILLQCLRSIAGSSPPACPWERPT